MRWATPPTEDEKRRRGFSKPLEDGEYARFDIALFDGAAGTVFMADQHSRDPHASARAMRDAARASQNDHYVAPGRSPQSAR